MWIWCAINWVFTMKVLASFLLIVLMAQFSLSVAALPAAKDERRLALILGNSKYEGLENLPNVKNDTSLMAKKLKSLGFDTKVVLNSSRKKMLKSINEFGAQLDDNDIGLFYYAGHAVQHDNVNYMIPSKGASEISSSSLEYDAVELDRVIAQMRDASSGTNIVIMDACRDNPFKSSIRSRGLGKTKGLAMPATGSRGLYIAYSTSPGEVAQDNDATNSRYSPYTRALANYIDKPGLGINDIFTKVRSEVIASTNNNQVPWEISSLTSDFFFSSDQTDEEKENELKIEAELQELKKLLAEERQAKIEAQKARQDSLEKLKENQLTLEQQTELLEKERVANERMSLEVSTDDVAVGADQLSLNEKLKQMQLELEQAKREQVQLEKAEKQRLEKVAKEKDSELKRQKVAYEKQKQKALAEERKRRKEELAELKKIEQLELEEKDKEARIAAKKKEQAERELKLVQDLLAKEKSASKAAELEAKRLAELEAAKAREAEAKLRDLLARQEATQKEALRLEQERLEKDAIERESMLAQIAESEKKRLEQERQSEIVIAKAGEAEKERLKQLTAKLALEEEKRIMREKQLVVAMVKNCEDFLKNSSPGEKVLSCYRDVLAIDDSNSNARKGLKKLQKIYNKKVAKSIKQKKLGKVTREYAVLESIDPVNAGKKFGNSIEKLREKLRESTEDSSKRVLPTF